MEVILNAQYFDNTTTVADKYPISILDLDLENEEFYANFNLVIDIYSVPHEDYSCEGKIG